MASRFWAHSSSSESDSDHSGSDSEVEIAQQQQRAAASRWRESDSESDEEVRVVKSAKDKAFENLEKCCGAIKNALKINDWTKVHAEFDALLKHLDKAKNVLAAQGNPAFYLRTLVQLDDAVNDKAKSKSDQKKMSKENSKALIRVKGKLKKHVETLQTAFDKFKANPVDSSASESSDDSSSDDESDSDDSSEDSSDASSKSSKSSKSSSDDDDSEDDSDDSDADSDDDDDESDDGSWPSGSSSSSSSDESDDGQLKGRARWLKKSPATATAKKERGPRQPKQSKARRDSADLTTQAPVVEEEIKLSVAQFDRRVKEIVALRGRKTMAGSEQLATLRKLATYARRLGPARQIVATMYLLGAQLFDATNKIDRFMPAAAWKAAHGDLSSLLTLLEANTGFSLAPLTTEDQADLVRASQAPEGDAAADADEDSASYVDTLPRAGARGEIKVSGDLAAFVERLAEEYTKSLQQTDPHTSEYIARLFDEALLVDVAQRVQAHYVRQQDYGRASVVALIKAELVYYKHETIATALHEAQAKRRVFGDPALLHPACNSVSAVATSKGDASVSHPGAWRGQPTVTVARLDAEQQLKDVCLFVFKHADHRAKTRAMLCRIYHHALHDRFHAARDLLLMSHIQDNITDADVSTQILFNRMMAQLGLCAFRQGLIWEAHACLSEICTGARTKELLAQGLASFRFQSERDAEQEKLERRRQVPYHQHINLDLLETCHLVSAMLLEVPNMVNTRAADHRKRLVSKAFRKLLEFHERLVFEGPPENPRDHVVAAAKALAQGSWQQASECLLSLSVWELFPGKDTCAQVKQMVQHKLQVEALRVYLLAFSDEYDSVALARLTDMFQLDAATVHSVVSKMMINDELRGAWDQSSQSVVLHAAHARSPLHTLALQYADKLANIVDNNERMMDLRSGTSKDDWANRRGGGGGASGGDGSGRRGGASGGDGGGRRFQSGGGRGGGGGGGGGRGGFRPQGAYQGQRRSGGGGGRGGYGGGDKKRS